MSRMSSHMHRPLAALVVGILVLSPLSAAHSVEREPLEVSHENPSDEGEYGTFAGADPLFVGDQETCRAATNCDVIDILFDPSGWEGPDKVFLEVKATMSWYDSNPAADLDMFVYDPDHNQVGQSATGGHPEIAGWSWDGREPITFSIVIYNFAGGEGTFYTMKVEALANELKDIPELVVPTAPPTIAPLPTPPPAPPPATQAGPAFTFPPVQTPGENGEPTDVKLTAIRAAAAQAGDSGTSGWLILGVAVGGLALVAGAGVVLQRRFAARGR